MIIPQIFKDGNTMYKGDRWDSNPQRAEPQSAALPIVLRPQSEERDSNPQPLVSDTSMLPLQYLQKSGASEIRTHSLLLAKQTFSPIRTMTP